MCYFFNFQQRINSCFLNWVMSLVIHFAYVLNIMKSTWKKNTFPKLPPNSNRYRQQESTIAQVNSSKSTEGIQWFPGNLASLWRSVWVLNRVPPEIRSFIWCSIKKNDKEDRMRKEISLVGKMPWLSLIEKIYWSRNKIIQLRYYLQFSFENQAKHI